MMHDAKIAGSAKLLRLAALFAAVSLLLLEPGSLSAPARARIETIRNMALRIHEVLQRFSSLEKELAVVAKQAEKESGKKTKKKKEKLIEENKKNEGKWINLRALEYLWMSFSQKRYGK
jgi:hypothetical protein